MILPCYIDSGNELEKKHYYIVTFYLFIGFFKEFLNSKIFHISFSSGRDGFGHFAAEIRNASFW